MKHFSLSLLLLLIISCSTDKKEMEVHGTIKGLKKGIVYLKKANDSIFITVDSTKIGKDSSFKLSANLEAPEAFYITLDSSVNKDNSINFFGYKGVTTIETSLKKFGYDTKIKGSKDQEYLEEYITMMRKFQNQNLDLIKEGLEAKKNNDTNDKKLINQQKRKYLYTTNFALNHKNSIVAPYIALTEINDANIKLLDTINNSLTNDIKKSKYGMALNKYINNIKK